MKRRKFIKISALGTAGASFSLPLFSQPLKGQSDKWGELLPLNDFGSTGQKVTMLGVGGFHVGRMTDLEAQKTIETAIEGGIRFFDAAESYVDGENERKYGRLLTPKYREDIFLLSKTKARDGATAQKHLEGSLRRMNTDYLDLWLMHQVDSAEEFEQIRNQGMLDVFIKAKESGKVKHIGFSGHHQPAANLYVFEQIGNTIEANMLPVNVLDPSYSSFIRNVVPELLQRKRGIIAMKTLAGGAFWGGGFEGRHNQANKVMDLITVEEAFNFALSMPQDVLVTGAKDATMLQEKINLAKNFNKMPEEQQEQLISKVARFAGSEVEYYKA
ncbi:MAG: aldo/keto reductase [Candidatus Cyclobacteriaceae bacterium M3_2C_046]